VTRRTTRQKKIVVAPHARNKPTGGKTRVRGHIRVISVPEHYTHLNVLNNKRYEYCEEGQYFDEGRLLADDVVAPNEITTDDVEELFEEKAGDTFEYLHAEKKRTSAWWETMTRKEREHYLKDRGFDPALASRSWRGLPHQTKQHITRAAWETMTIKEREQVLAAKNLPVGHASRTWDGLPVAVRKVKWFKVYGVPEHDVPKPMGTCDQPVCSSQTTESGGTTPCHEKRGNLP